MYGTHVNPSVGSEMVFTESSVNMVVSKNLLPLVEFVAKGFVAMIVFEMVAVQSPSLKALGTLELSAQFLKRKCLKKNNFRSVWKELMLTMNMLDENFCTLFELESLDYPVPFFVKCYKLANVSDIGFQGQNNCSVREKASVHACLFSNRP